MAAVRAMPNTSPLGVAAGGDELQGFTAHVNEAISNCHAMRFALGADIDHVRFASVVEMG